MPAPPTICFLSFYSISVYHKNGEFLYPYRPESHSRQNQFFRCVINRTGIVLLFQLIPIKSRPQVLIAEVVTQSFKGNRFTVLQGVLLTRRTHGHNCFEISAGSVRRQAPKNHSYTGYAGTSSRDRGYFQKKIVVVDIYSLRK